jgi:hypothetical protein
MQQEMLKRVQEQIERSADPKYYADLAYRLIAGGAQSIDTFQKTFFDLLSSTDRKTPKPPGND